MDLMLTLFVLPGILGKLQHGRASSLPQLADLLGEGEGLSGTSGQYTPALRCSFPSQHVETEKKCLL